MKGLLAVLAQCWRHPKLRPVWTPGGWTLALTVKQEPKEIP